MNHSQGDIPTGGRRDPPPPPPATGSRSYRSLGDISTSGGQGRLLDGSVLAGKYRIEKKLGEGGMGEVWQAHDTIGQRTVALKVLPAEAQANTREIDRTRTTFRRVCEFQHQHVCPTLDLGHDPAVGYFLVMKFIRGINLSEYRRGYTLQHGQMTPAEVVRLLKPVAEALDYIHSQGIIHRDIKPENILVINNGADVQLVDFGLASEIHTGLGAAGTRPEVNGTYPYMSPEQWKGEFQDGRTDQYSLAVVGYALLSGGRLPFEGSESHELKQRILHDPVPVIPNIPPAIYRVLQQGMAKQSDQRFPSCLAFVAALAVAGGQPAGAPPPTRLPGQGAAAPPAARPPVAARSGAGRPQKPSASSGQMNAVRMSPAASGSMPAAPPAPPKSTPRGSGYPTPAPSGSHPTPLAPPALPGPLGRLKHTLEQRFGADLFRGWKLAALIAGGVFLFVVLCSCLIAILLSSGQYRPTFN